MSEFNHSKGGIDIRVSKSSDVHPAMPAIVSNGPSQAVEAAEWNTAILGFIDAMRVLPRDPLLRAAIRRPPIRPVPNILNREIPTGSSFDLESIAPVEQFDLQQLKLEQLAWSLYWADIAERIDMLFVKPRHRRRISRARNALVEVRIDAALHLADKGCLPMLALSWPLAIADSKHAAERHQRLFVLVDQELAAQSDRYERRSVVVACAAVQKRLKSRDHADHKLLVYGEQRKLMSAKSLRELYAKRNQWTRQRQAAAVNRGAVMAIRADLIKMAKRKMPRSKPRDL